MKKFHAHRILARRSAAITYRSTVLAIIEQSGQCLTGQEISIRAGLTYRQTVDALNALHNLAKIRREGRKFTARWCSLPDERPTALLERILWSIARKTRKTRS